MTLTRRQLLDLLTTHGLRPSRALGQNFVVDPNMVRKVARLADVGPGDRVLEIGPGVGSLTTALVETGAEVLAVEADRHLMPVLEAVVVAPNLQLVHGDAMTADWASLLGEQRGWVLVANLPYNIATPLIADLLDQVPAVERMLGMIQKEVGDRLVAAPGDHAFGAVSVKVRYWAEATIAGHVPASVFHPKPKVESVLVSIRRRPAPALDPDRVDAGALFELVRAGFATRRKMLRRALSGLVPAEAFAAAGVSPESRAQELDVDDWGRLAIAVAELRAAAATDGAEVQAGPPAGLTAGSAEGDGDGVDAGMADEGAGGEDAGAGAGDEGAGAEDPELPAVPVDTPTAVTGEVPEADPDAAGPDAGDADDEEAPEPEVEPVTADETAPSRSFVFRRGRSRPGRRRRGAPEPVAPLPVSLDAPAKLTLSLRIVGVRPDGYHLLEAEMVSLDLMDSLDLSEGEGMEIEGPEGRSAPPGDENLVSRALVLAGKQAKVKLHKRIPVGAGLGGGSADAAAVLRWAGVSDLELAAGLGADVPFCLVGGRAMVKGIGEQVEPLPISDLAGQEYTLLTPPLEISTARVYAVWDELGGPEGPHGNDLEPAALAMEPGLAQWRAELAEATGEEPFLAGSGGTWFVPGAYPGPGRRVVRVAG